MSGLTALLLMSGHIVFAEETLMKNTRNIPEELEVISPAYRQPAEQAGILLL